MKLSISIYFILLMLCPFGGDVFALVPEIKSRLEQSRWYSENMDLVRNVQANLIVMGYLNPPVDGIPGLETQRAVREYQRSHGLPVNGKITSDFAKTVAAAVASGMDSRFCAGGNCVSGRGHLVSQEYDYQGDFSKGEFSGTGILREQNGNLYEGSFLHGKKWGKGKQTWADGRIYQGEWSSGFPEGRGELFLSDGRKTRGIWKKGILQSEAAPINPFADFSWQDSILSVLEKLNGMDGVDKLFAHNLYRPFMFKETHDYVAGPGFADLSNVHDKDELEVRLYEVTSGDVTYYNGSEKVTGMVPSISYSGLPGKYLEGMTLHASPVYIKGIPFRLVFHFEVNPGLALKYPEQVYKDLNDYSYAMVLVEIEVKSFAGLTPEIFDKTVVLDSWEQLEEQLSSKYAYHQIRRDFFEDEYGTIIRLKGFDKTWSESHSIIYTSDQWFQTLLNQYNQRNLLRERFPIDLSDSL